MPTLEHDSLVFRFPQIEEEASFAIDFQRTLRIPDSDETYHLPPGLGRFPLRHAEDYSTRLPTHTASRGGVIFPMWQAEAMWIDFRNIGPDLELDFPVAVKIAAGKINAITGDPWRAGLTRDPQDYVVSPEQPWLDGYAVEKDVIRQFVAMPLGECYSAEEQLTGEAEWGGLQISVIPLKKEVWSAKRAAWERGKAALQERADILPDMACMSMEMSLAPGGRMHQAIEPDPFELDDWDTAAADRVFVTLVHGKDWKTVTGEPAPEHPPTARMYTEAGLPWFSHYGADQTALPGSGTLRGLKSAGAMHEILTGASLPDSEDVEVKVVVPTEPRRLIATGSWDK
ncbi:hypothetical protein [Tranquillimonas alkanivorans]|uniref:Integral membrane protein n=1 Tax=Tranquillimonas alkanivorans TaxID=441119 RepID=A0A1I5WA13_9RHOB|nr:hypothetical protein [Tranquillimonas alkanivorans]SFQ16580.1 hypothetical protein SAMN04488047_14216 [Tranquillimonas alkanivorans]